MDYKRFEDLDIWKRANSFSFEVYKYFEKSKDFNFRNQMQRASLSIMNNIAEGFEIRTNNEFRQFLFIAKGSCAEVRSMLHLAKKLGYIDELNYKKLIKESQEISRMISGFIKSLNKFISTDK